MPPLREVKKTWRPVRSGTDAQAKHFRSHFWSLHVRQENPRLCAPEPTRVDTYRRKARLHEDCRTASLDAEIEPSRKSKNYSSFRNTRPVAFTATFRLEMDGTLQVVGGPKGPPYDPSTERRLAMATGRSRSEYAKFEGLIPRENDGGGTVMVWGTSAPTS